MQEKKDGERRNSRDDTTFNTPNTDKTYSSKKSTEHLLREYKKRISENDREILKDFIRESLKKYSGITAEELLKILTEEKEEIPASIFSRKLGSLEAITKYFVEEKKYSLSKIALILK
ncbi:MAG: hypothetical protein NTV63_04490 [Candidatus Woesearchaeota archaeon]|nr:hypothetical protein [Candidatus Woesearchaeota archaeon]